MKAFISEENPLFKRGDKYGITIKEKSETVIIRNIYTRRLEDLTFNDLEMIGYTNPNLFVKEWISKYGSFDKAKIVWVVVYMDMNAKEDLL
ncbi:MAG: hypothetical protein ABGF52_12300 [Candidatus Asgardarchaeum sp.]